MRRRPLDIRFAANFLACFALFFQALAPYAVAAARGVDVSTILCEPAGLNNAAASDAAALIAELTGDAPSDKAPGDKGHCSACLLAHGAPVPEIGFAAQLVAFAAILDRPAPEALHSYFAQGPPLGLRAPPTTTL